MRRVQYFYKALVVGDAAVVTEAWSDREIKRVTEPIRGRNNYYYWTRDGEHVAVGRSSDDDLLASHYLAAPTPSTTSTQALAMRT